MLRHLGLLAVCLLLCVTHQSFADFPQFNMPEAFADDLAAADAAYDAKSFMLASQAYAALQDAVEADSEAHAYVTWKRYESQIRAVALNQRRNSKAVEAAKQALQALAETLETAADGERPPRLWAEVQASLHQANLNHSYRANGPLARALDWWAGSTDLELARERYLDLVFTAAWPQEVFPDVTPEQGYAYAIGQHQLRKALSLTQDREQRAALLYLLTKSQVLLTKSQVSQGYLARIEVRSLFEELIATAESTRWHFPALDAYARYLQNFGSYEWDAGGRIRFSPDGEAALAHWRKLAKLAPSDSRWHRSAKQAISQLTNKDLSVHVANTFLPQSPIQLDVQARNAGELELSILPMTEADILASFEGVLAENVLRNGSGLALAAERASDREPLWTQRVADGLGKPYQANKRSFMLQDGLPLGLYLVVARGDGIAGYQWLLVSDLALLTHQDHDQMLAWVVDARTGEPVEDAVVETHHRSFDWQRGKPQFSEWDRISATTPKTGDVLLPLPEFAKNRQHRVNHSVIVTARVGDRVVFLYDEDTHFHLDRTPDFRVYAFTDRPAYRPEDTVQWRAYVRDEVEGSLRVQEGLDVNWQIDGPNGKIAEGTASTNRYGSIGGSLPLPSDATLGSYEVQFRIKGEWLSAAELFRLEAYKLPEFQVTVSPEPPEGEQIGYRLGDTVRVSVAAEYYFGGPVADADVEVVVSRAPYYATWQRPLPYGWLVDDELDRHHHWSPQTEISRHKLTTDAAGKASFEVPTHFTGSQNWEYSVEARVVDNSRREIVGHGSFRVSDKPYAVFLDPVRHIWRPGELAEVAIRAQTASQQSVSVEGRVIISRVVPNEYWIGPNGERLSGAEIRERRSLGGLFRKRTDYDDWHRVLANQQYEPVADMRLTTDADGLAMAQATLDTVGIYRFQWQSQDRYGMPIVAETLVWVAETGQLDVGYHGDLQLILPNTVASQGQTLPVLLTTPHPNSQVLLTVDAGGLREHRVVSVRDTAAMVEFEVDAAWVPTVHLQACMLHDLESFADSVALQVPPVEHFLDVEVKPSKASYLPGESGSVTVRVTDHTGAPVAAEVALSVYDEAVEAIQAPLADDPRAFFYGNTRHPTLTSDDSLNVRRYPVVNALTGLAAHPAEPSRMVSSSSVGVDPFAGPLIPELAVASRSFGDVEPQVVVRHDFRATAHFTPEVLTDSDGIAQIAVDFPESTTRWKALAWAVGLPARFGQGLASTQTRLPLIARLQAPRFFLVGDTVTLSGVFTNNTGSDKQVTATLQATAALELASTSPGNLARQTLTVPANGSARADFTATVVASGEVTLTLKGSDGQTGDGMEKTFPVYPHGIEKRVATSGRMSADAQSLRFDFTLPAYRASDAEFSLQLSPSLALSLVDALPYLAKYPYGCTEQTLSRFVPAVVVARALQETGLSREAILDDFASKGRSSHKATIGDLDAMVTQGLKRIYDMQHANGGWGWWKTSRTDLYMSTYAVWSLTLASDSGVDVKADVLERGRRYLLEHLDDADGDGNLQSWVLFALSSRYMEGGPAKPERAEAQASARLWKNREGLSSYARALLAATMAWLDFNQEAATLAENLSNAVTQDDNPMGSALGIGSETAEPYALKTAHWGRQQQWWHWHDGATESTAYALLALSVIDPENALAQQAANWLVVNRQASRWNNTRDTAIAILALCEWAKRSGELAADWQVQITINGKTYHKMATDGTQSGEFTLPASAFQEGVNTVTLERLGGSGPVYFALGADFWSLERPIQPAGNLLFVEREYYRIQPIPTLLNGYDYRREPLASGARLNSGDRIEVVLHIEAKNELEYLMFEDLKPAGLEAVSLQSGNNLRARRLDAQTHSEAARQVMVYQELRDRKVANFIDRLPQGLWELKYTLRAEVPGDFAALPVLGEAMYVPTIRANGTETELTVTEP